MTSMGRAGRVRRLLTTVLIKRVPQLIATFLILDLAKVFHAALFEGGIWQYREWTDFSWIEILVCDGWGYFGDSIWILGIELFVYVPIALYWIFREDLKRLKRYVIDYRKGGDY